MFLWPLISIFGLIIGLRTAKYFHFYVLHALLICLIPIFLLKNYPLALFFVFIGTLFVPIIHRFHTFWNFERQLSKEFVSFLDELLLIMHTGGSFLFAMSESASRFPQFVSHELSKVVQNKDYKPPWVASKVIQAWLEELQIVAVAPSRQMQRLESLRNQILLQQDFRQKSSAVTASVRAQFAVITFLYISLLIFSFFKWNAKEIDFLVTLSLSLYLLGTLIFCFLIQRGIRWKI